MASLSPGQLAPLISKAAKLGMSGSETLRVFRQAGVEIRTQTFFAAYRQARAAALGIPELQLMSKSAFVPDRLVQQGGEMQRYQYQYYVRYETLHGETGEMRTAYYTIGSNSPMTKGQVVDTGSELARGALTTTNVILTDVQIERASVRGQLT